MSQTNGQDADEANSRRPAGPLTGPLALITGASSGIGREVALVLARRGYRTLLIARRRDRLEQLAAELMPLAPSHPVALDLADMDAIEPALAPWLETHGPAQVLVNAAGYGVFEPFLDLSLAEHQRLMAVNYFAAVAMTRAVLPGMVQQRRGHVINIASISTKVSPWGHSAYTAAKSALLALTFTLEAEYGGSGLHFSCVHPGMVRTEFFEQPSYDKMDQRVRRHTIAPHRVARRIVSLLDHPRMEVTVPAHYRIIEWLGLMWPGFVHRVLAQKSRPACVRAAEPSPTRHTPKV